MKMTKKELLGEIELLLGPGERPESRGQVAAPTGLTSPDGTRGALRDHRNETPDGYETRYRHLVERSLQGVVIARGYPPRLIFANEALAQMLGYGVDELCEMAPERLWGLIHPEDRTVFIQRYRERISGKPVTTHYDFRIVRKDGSVGRLEMFASMIEMDGETVVQASFVDITDRKRAEEQLDQSEEKYRAIIDNIQEGYYEVDLSGNLTLFNRAFLTILGYGADEMIGMNNRSFMDGENAEKVFRVFNGVYRSGASVRACDWEIIRNDGEKRIVEASVTLIRDAAGAPAGFRGIIRDVTEQKTMARLLAESERRYHTVYDVAPLAFVLWDRERRITGWNRHAEKVFGWRREEVLGEDLLEFLIPESERPRIAKVVEKLVRGVLPGHVIIENLTKRGKVITCEWNNTVFRDNEGRIEEVLSLALDLTDRKKLEEELFQSRKMESIGRLAGGVAHDLNNMLTPIIGYAEILLLDSPMEEPHLEGLIQIKDAAERARDMAHQLLAFGRKQVLEMKTVDLGAAVSSFEKILRRTIREDIELAIRLPSEPCTIRTDPSQIEQILLNLAVNAQDAMPGGGMIVIEVARVTIDDKFAKHHPDARPGEHALLSISDTGCGMDSETLEQVFEPFFTTRESGTGLGLATVYGIVRQHNGCVRASSRPGSGTTFLIYLPRVDGVAVEGRIIPRAPVGPAAGETILVVEDEVSVRTLAEKILSKMGYRVLTASNGEEAIGVISGFAGKIHLLLTDVIMPKMDGKKLYREVAALRDDIKVVFMSGYPHDVIARRGVMEEGVHFIQKPFSFTALLEKIREALDS
ncbi:MAG: PAS domain S-box protein [Chrysiogenales bacterium]|nr:MAG: PAS domain S-box protein [Chrysiogenales bacterium]